VLTGVGIVPFWTVAFALGGTKKQEAGSRKQEAGSRKQEAEDGTLKWEH